MKNIIVKLSLRALRTLKTLNALLALVACLSGCVKEHLYNTGHPNHGKIISLATDWTNRGEGVEIPASYHITVGDYTTTLSGTTNEVNNDFEAGAYHINIWNPANNISVAGTTATANYAAGELGWLFTGSQDVVIEKDKDHAFTVAMQQQVRQLTLVLEPTGDAADRVTGIAATLSGVAGAIGIDNGNPVGDPVAVVPVFVRQPDGKYTAVLRLLGIQGNAQTLTLTLHFDGGLPADITVNSGLSEKIAPFNADKKTPFTLKAGVTVTATVLGVAAEISDWENAGNETVVAN
ncbi:hypothetical protein FACS189416_5450 [Bacteroidia bacterium]|nr:hypothetical protein FACS189416_5450 [Bacteroidia bacterium]